MLPQLRQHRHLEVRRRMLALLLARLPVLLCLLLANLLPPQQTRPASLESALMFRRRSLRRLLQLRLSLFLVVFRQRKLLGKLLRMLVPLVRPALR